jgi:limonene-1,2-epoxide hydrolase
MGSCIPDDACWELAGRFLDTLLRRDFDALQSCLSATVRCQVLEPSGAWSVTGAVDTAAAIRAWFGAAELFEVHDAAIGQVGSRVYLRWRIAQGAARASATEIVEQHAFVTIENRIAAMDLLSSGLEQPDIASGGGLPSARQAW